MLGPCLHAQCSCFSYIFCWLSCCENENAPGSFLMNGGFMSNLAVLGHEWLCNKRLHILASSSTLSPLNSFRAPRWMPYVPCDLFTPYLSVRFLSIFCGFNSDLTPVQWGGQSGKDFYFWGCLLYQEYHRLVPLILHLISLWWTKTSVIALASVSFIFGLSSWGVVLFRCHFFFHGLFEIFT